MKQFWEGEAPAEPRFTKRHPSLKHSRFFDFLEPDQWNQCIVSPHPKRKHPAHGVIHLQDQPTVIFGTVCTKDRKRWLANETIHKSLIEIWGSARAWVMGRYVIMPDHIHFFAGATESSIPFDNWVRYWKSQFSKSRKTPACKWQSQHWDTRLRTERAYAEKWEYVRFNPVRHGLVKAPDQWSYQGEFFDLRWDQCLTQSCGGFQIAARREPRPPDELHPIW